MPGLSGLESATPYELIISSYRAPSFIIIDNAAVEEWLSLFDDSILGNCARDRLVNAFFRIVDVGATHCASLSPHRKLLGYGG